MPQRRLFSPHLIALFLNTLLLIVPGRLISLAASNSQPSQHSIPFRQKDLGTGLIEAQLTGVTAISKDDVWAVGYASPTNHKYCDCVPLVEHWNRERWQIVRDASSPGTPTMLYAIAAINKNDIWAAGITIYSQPFIEHWNGLNWQKTDSPFVPSGGGPYNAVIDSIAAINHTNVWAVGQTDSGKPLVEHWNGKNWQIVSIPDAESFGYTGYQLNEGLSMVDALSANDIYVAGFNLLEHWDGTNWTILEHPTFVRNEDFTHGMTAISDNDLWESNPSFSNSIDNPPILAHWSGHAWHFYEYPTPSFNEDCALNAMLSLDSHNVWTVGSCQWYNPPPGVHNHTLIGHWDGQHWLFSAPTPSGASHIQLHTISASSANDIWTVGSTTNGALIEHWNGSSWKIIPDATSTLSPSLARQGEQPLKSQEVLNPDERVLLSTSAVSSNDVWAAGYYSSGTDMSPIGGTILKHWNGKNWQDIQMPGNTTLTRSYGVKAFSKTDVYVMVGTVLTHWDGNQWQTVPTNFATQTPQVMAGDAPNNRWLAGNGFLQSWNGQLWQTILDPSVNVNALVVLNKNDVWLMGRDISQTDGPLVIQHWDGKKLSRLPSQTLANPDDTIFTSIAAVDDQNLWVTGNVRGHSLMLYWNGLLWKEVEHPDPSLFDNRLSSITAISKNDIWAAGSAQMNTCLFYCAKQSLIEHWNGMQWQVVSSPNVFLPKNVVQDTVLNNITALSSTDAWAVGTSYNGYAYSDHYSSYHGKTLTEHWNGKTWQVVPSDS